jgi:hypothetical protein
MIIHATLESIDILLTGGDLKNLAKNGSIALIYIAAVFKQITFTFCEKHIKVIDKQNMMASGGMEVLFLNWALVGDSDQLYGPSALHLREALLTRIHGRLNVSQSRSGCFGGDIFFPASNLTTIPTTPSLLEVVPFTLFLNVTAIMEHYST